MTPPDAVTLVRAPFGPTTAQDVHTALTIAHRRHREPVTVAELAWVWAAEKEWANNKPAGPQVIVDPTSRDLAGLRRQLLNLQAAGLATTTAGRPQRWLPTSSGRDAP